MAGPQKQGGTLLVRELHAMLCPEVPPGQVRGRPRCLRDAGDEDPSQFRGKKHPVVVLKSPKFSEIFKVMRAEAVRDLEELADELEREDSRRIPNLTRDRCHTDTRDGVDNATRRA